jgi:hypothetical protein
MVVAQSIPSPREYTPTSALTVLTVHFTTVALAKVDLGSPSILSASGLVSDHVVLPEVNPEGVRAG